MDTGPESRRFFVINLYFFFFVVLDIWNLIRYSHESWKSAACFQMFQNVFYTIHFSWVIGVLSMLYTSQKLVSDIWKNPGDRLPSRSSGAIRINQPVKSDIKNVMCRFSKCNVFYVPFTTISFFFGGLHSDQDIYDIRHIAILL